MNETKLKILDAAERLMAQQGIDVSLRAITTAADVNLAAVNYHFHSKDSLLDAVVARHMCPINERRIQMLDALERDYPNGPLPLEDILRAFLAPVFELEHGEHVRVLFGRFYSMPDEFMERIYKRHLTPIVNRFSAALARATPGLQIPDRLWAMNFTVGAMVHTLTWSRLLGVMSNGAVDLPDTGRVIDNLVRFSAAGFRALEQRSKEERRNA